MAPGRRNPRSIAILIPALNEEEGIGPTLDEIPRQRLEEMGLRVEVVVVDGNSRDRTRDIARAKGARVVVEPRKGYGRAYKTGLRSTEADLIATGDADLTYPFADLPDLVERFLRADLDFVTGDRLRQLDPGVMRPMHKVGNALLSLAAQVLFLRRLHDSQSGMWLFRRSLLPRLHLTSDGMAFSEEIKLEAFRARGVRCAEWPIRYRARVGEVKLQSWQDGLKCLRFLLRMRLGLRPRPAAEPLPAFLAPLAEA